MGFVGFEGAPQKHLLRGDFGINKAKYVGFNFYVDQFKLADFNRTSITLGYAYNIPETNWSFGLGITPNWSQFNLENIQTYEQDFTYNTDPMPGIAVSGGVVYSGESLIFSLAGKQMILGNKDLNGLDQTLTKNALFDIGYKPIAKETFGIYCWNRNKWF